MHINIADRIGAAPRKTIIDAFHTGRLVDVVSDPCEIFCETIQRFIEFFILVAVRMHSQGMTILHDPLQSRLRFRAILSHHKKSSFHMIPVQNIQYLIGINTGTVIKCQINLVNHLLSWITLRRMLRHFTGSYFFLCLDTLLYCSL